jgi:hypothetical protein
MKLKRRPVQQHKMIRLQSSLIGDFQKVGSKKEEEEDDDEVGLR